MDAISDRASVLVNQHDHMLRHGGNMPFPQYIDVVVSEEESETGETITVNIDMDDVTLHEELFDYPDYLINKPVLTSAYG